MPEVMPIGERVRKIRKTKKLTIIQLAEEAGVGEKTVRRIESGTENFTLQSLQLVVAPLGYAIEYKLRQLTFVEV